MAKGWRRKPVPVGEALRGLLRDMGLEGRLAEVEIARIWPRVVGRTLAERTRPVRLDGGRLLVHAMDSASLHRVSLMRRDIVRDLNDAVGSPAVKEVRLRIGSLADAAPADLRAASLRRLHDIPVTDPDDPVIREAMARVKGLPFEEVLQRIVQRQAMARQLR